MLILSGMVASALVIFAIWLMNHTADRKALLERAKGTPPPDGFGFHTPPKGEALNALIDDLDAWLKDFPQDEQIQQKRDGLLLQRAQNLAEAGQTDDCLRDIRRVIATRKSDGDAALYAATVLFEIYVLEQAGRWQEAIKQCRALIDECGEKAGFRPYATLVHLIKKTPDPTLRDERVMAEARVAAIRLSQNDWQEND
jgi:tetratricopeptide (TPR) repeat protein